MKESVLKAEPEVGRPIRAKAVRNSNVLHIVTLKHLEHIFGPGVDRQIRAKAVRSPKVLVQADVPQTVRAVGILVLP